MNSSYRISWAVIILALIFFWPLGLFLIYRKFSKERIVELQNSKALRVVGWFFIIMAVGFLCSKAGYNNEVSEGVVMTRNSGPTTQEFNNTMNFLIVFCGGGGLLMLYVARRMKLKVRRIQKYIALVDGKNITSIDNIASAIPIKYSDAIEDLQSLINKGYFPESYIDHESRQIVKPQRTFTKVVYEEHVWKSRENSELKQEPKKEPKTKVVTCKNCGANNTITEGLVGECEYCGSPIS
ncbi:MAG TPA: hypothetical protein VHQ24_07080 [Lachnospiraceae bacterium]|nr:hypothetical protein [Lachnospiraceae bacterium]